MGTTDPNSEVRGEVFDVFIEVSFVRWKGRGDRGSCTHAYRYAEPGRAELVSMATYLEKDEARQHRILLLQLHHWMGVGDRNEAVIPPRI